MLDPLYRLVARGIVTFHDGLMHVFPAGKGDGKSAGDFFAYALAIAFIVVIVRIVIFPLFVRSVKAQRTMQMLQPRMKEIREKYKNDRQRMNEEIMKLQKEHGNPLLGCLPLLLQIPLFIALFHTFNAIAPKADSKAPGGFSFHAASGLTSDQVAQIAHAKAGGISLAASLTSSHGMLQFLGANGAAVRVVAVLLILIMAVTTFITQRQIMSRNGPVDPQQQTIQRVMLYGSPIMLAVFGVRFPIAVLVYWLVTNTWSMGQQFFIIRKMPPIKAAGAAGGRAAGTPAAARASAGAKGATKADVPVTPPRLTQVRQPSASDGNRSDGNRTDGNRSDGNAQRAPAVSAPPRGRPANRRRSKGQRKGGRR